VQEQEDVAVEFVGFGNAAIVEQGIDLLRREQGESVFGSRGATNFGSSTFRVEFARKWLAAWAEIMMPLKAQYLSGAIYLSVLAMRKGPPPEELVLSLYLQPL